MANISYNEKGLKGRVILLENKYINENPKKWFQIKRKQQQERETII